MVKNLKQITLYHVSTRQHYSFLAAMRVHFRTKRRQEVNKSRNAAQDVLKQQRARSRLNTVNNIKNSSCFEFFCC